jgi:hypothetical protein
MLCITRAKAGYATRRWIVGIIVRNSHAVAVRPIAAMSPFVNYGSCKTAFAVGWAAQAKSHCSCIVYCSSFRIGTIHVTSITRAVRCVTFQSDLSRPTFTLNTRPESVIRDPTKIVAFCLNCICSFSGVIRCAIGTRDVCRKRIQSERIDHFSWRACGVRVSTTTRSNTYRIALQISSCAKIVVTSEVVVRSALRIPNLPRKAIVERDASPSSSPPKHSFV